MSAGTSISDEKQAWVDRIIQSYQSGVEDLSAQYRKFARVISQWILQPKYQYIQRSMAAGNAKELVMFSNLSSFLKDEARASIEIVSLAEFCLIVQSERQWLLTSPDAVSLIVNSEGSKLGEYFSFIFQDNPNHG